MILCSRPALPTSPHQPQDCEEEGRRRREGRLLLVGSHITFGSLGHVEDRKKWYQLGISANVNHGRFMVFSSTHVSEASSQGQYSTIPTRRRIRQGSEKGPNDWTPRLKGSPTGSATWLLERGPSGFLGKKAQSPIMPHDNDEKVKAGGCCVGYACCWLLLGFLFAFFCSLLLLASSFLILTNCKTTTTPLLFMIIQSLHAVMSCIFLDFIDFSSKVYGYVQRYVVCRDEDSNIRPHPPQTCVCAKSRVFFVFDF